MALPNILPLESNANCLCQNCLITQINTFLALQYQTQPVETLLALAAPYQSSPSSIAGLDYTIEQGFYVFSSWSHLKRGYCCGNGCKHCPWKFKNRSRSS
ncbi:DUF5522 domain-containing protein [Pseudoalteromonas tunicata]|nr:DUF5522 domain-containing protein [Pseudoalteromonas tunicata]AXT32677.1 hypothetical protein D1819_12020 [Pseudoalteromonas tunicata]MDP4983733.1 DUF5522 domain-containing protein [Pseudoalteromonas tunicata]